MSSWLERGHGGVAVKRWGDVMSGVSIAAMWEWPAWTWAILLLLKWAAKARGRAEDTPVGT
ncbi:hypothetical protein VFPPC_03263 [Pochonia chlamydosporia 170]|uniref:Uncharacterized protein n=1 Tax=Pochonia chlamydosporia 170 TaxID=1380566 RepID=A0A179G0A5_METCM|nr:hypothetical protein VFPPC_03263 [Pochonia chlamydosporia 170]OAQ70870.2 hypothetical protein VFPPC_03263 [Pochonia chlamydosporia 170]